MRTLLPFAPVALAALLLAGCATEQESPPAEDPDALTSVVAQGTVIQVADAAPELCLGAVAESYPPQCTGVELTGWDWDGVEGQETASDVTWGTYAVWGEWDGTRLDVTSQIQLALYDPMPIEDPYLDPANAGTTDEAELAAIQESIHDEAPVEVLMSWVENGYVFVSVEFDDGDVQAWADQTYGPDVVRVRSALQPVDSN